VKKFLAGLTLLFLAGTAHASYITLRTRVDAKTVNNNLQVRVHVTNNGDESAFNVQAEIQAAGKKILSDKRDELKVNYAYEGTANLPLKLNKPGNYPLVLFIHYTDANQYPFSALAVRNYVFGRETLSPLFGQGAPASFQKEGEIKFRLKNSADNDVKAKITLVFPRELASDRPWQVASARGKTETEVIFKVKNFSALPGSTYQVFAIVESEDDSAHSTSIIPATVKITAGQELFGINYFLIGTALAVLLLLFFGAEFLSHKKK